MKFDFARAWKNVPDSNNLSSEENLVGAIELSDEDLAEVVGVGDRDHHRRRRHFRDDFFEDDEGDDDDFFFRRHRFFFHRRRRFFGDF